MMSHETNTMPGKDIDAKHDLEVKHMNLPLKIGVGYGQMTFGQEEADESMTCASHDMTTTVSGHYTMSQFAPDESILI